MTAKIKKARLAVIVFLTAILILTYFVIQEHNVLDIVYLSFLVVYFVRFLLIRLHS